MCFRLTLLPVNAPARQCKYSQKADFILTDLNFITESIPTHTNRIVLEASNQLKKNVFKSSDGVILITGAPFLV